MARTYAQVWLDALGKDFLEPVGYCQIHMSPTISFVFHSLSRRYPTSDASKSYHMGLSGFSPIESELDPFERTTTTADWHIEIVDDGVLRDIAATHSLKGKRIELRHGESSLDDPDDLETIHDELIIDEVLPSPGKLTLICKNWIHWLYDGLLSPTYRAPDHPKRVLRDLIKGRIGSSVTDDTSFDETANAATSHHVVCRQFANNLQKLTLLQPTEENLIVRAMAHVHDLTKLTRGAIIVDKSNIKFVDYDRARTAAHTFTANEIANFRQIGNYENTITDLLVSGNGGFSGPDTTIHPEEARDGTVSTVYMRSIDTTAQNDFNYPSVILGDAPRSYSQEIHFPWLNSVTELGGIAVKSRNNTTLTNTSGGTSTFTTYVPLYSGLTGTVIDDGAGTRLGPPTKTQQAIHTINGTTRPAWFLLAN